MSYCRFSEADAYIFEHIGGFFQCCACFLEEEPFSSFDCNTREEMLAHIALHREKGHYIPLDVDERLKKEIENETEGLKKILDRIPKEWGKWISCDKGWYPLIIELDEKLSEIDPDYEIHQVKEKFGTLRYYIGVSPDKNDVYDQLSQIVHEYEDLSASTCESCGSPGELRSHNYWVKTLCSECAIKQGYKESP